MAKVKKISINVTRVHNNHFIVQGRAFNYFELLNWFSEILTEQ